MSTSTKTANYNQGALAGIYSTIDLSNTGKITNSVHAIPQRHSCQIAGTMVNILAGSVVSIYDGFTEDGSHTPITLHQTMNRKYEVDTGKTVKKTDFDTSSPEDYRYICYCPIEDMFRIFNKNEITFNVAENTFTYIFGGTQRRKASVPVAVLDKNNTLKEFSAVAFYGYYIFISEGVEFDIASGRDFSKRFAMDHNYIAQDMVTEILSRAGRTLTATLLVDREGNAVIADTYQEIKAKNEAHTGYAYVLEDSIIIDKNNVTFDGVKFGKIQLKEGLVCDIHTINMFQAASQVDIIEHTSSVIGALQEVYNLIEGCTDNYKTNKPTMNKDGSFNWENPPAEWERKY